MELNQFDSFYEGFYPKVYGYFFRRTENQEDTEDLTSLTLTNFFKVCSKTEIKFPKTYLWKIAHNQLCAFIKDKNKKEIPIGLDEEMDSKAFNIDNSIEFYRSQHYQSRISSLLECIRHFVSPLDYKILTESFLEEKTSISIGENFGLQPATIRQKISRMLKKVRQKCAEVWQKSF